MAKRILRYKQLIRSLAWGVIIVVISAGCVHIPSRIKGTPSVSSSPAVPWTPPPSVVSKMPSQPMASTIPLAQIRNEHPRLTLADAVNIALRNNPATQAAWADARSAAARYGATRGTWFPTINLTGSLTHSKGTTSLSQFQGPITNTIAGASLSYLLLDFGGRSGLIEEARQALIAANWNQNAVLQNVILQVEVAFFNNLGAQAMLKANQTSLKEAEANLTAAEERRRMGMATSADVLQSRTATAEAKLAVEEAEGNVRTAQGALAIAMGYTANTSFELEDGISVNPDTSITQSVDQLITRAFSSNPSLQASRAVTQEAVARIRQARSDLFPTLSASASVSRAWNKNIQEPTFPYSLSLGLQIPLFNGFTNQFNLLQAREDAEAARRNMQSMEQQTSYDVFSAHSDFITAGHRVKTTNELVESATQSEEVALGRYREGVGSILDLLSAQRALASARSQQINARMSWFIALAQLAHNVGVLNPNGDNPLIPGAIFGK
ncbi:MAG: TolC family protein [Candidatus Omnitrophota bacterium]